MIEACRRLVSFLCRFCRSNSTSFFIPAASESSFCTLVRDIRVPSFFSKAISSAFSMARCSGYCSVSRVQQPCFSSPFVVFCRFVCAAFADSGAWTSTHHLPPCWMLCVYIVASPYVIPCPTFRRYAHHCPILLLCTQAHSSSCVELCVSSSSDY